MTEISNTQNLEDSTYPSDICLYDSMDPITFLPQRKGTTYTFSLNSFLDVYSTFVLYSEKTHDLHSHIKSYMTKCFGKTFQEKKEPYISYTQMLSKNEPKMLENYYCLDLQSVIALKLGSIFSQASILVKLTKKIPDLKLMCSGGYFIGKRREEIMNTKIPVELPFTDHRYKHVKIRKGKNYIKLDSDESIKIVKIIIKSSKPLESIGKKIGVLESSQTPSTYFSTVIPFQENCKISENIYILPFQHPNGAEKSLVICSKTETELWITSLFSNTVLFKDGIMSVTFK